MRNRFLSFIVLIMSLCLSVQAQTYDKLWKEVELLQNKDLPQSVIVEAMKIYHKAKTEQNVAQMMKAYLTAMQCRHMLTPDSLETDSKGLEEWATQTVNVGDKAMLYAILSEITMPKDAKLAFDYLHRSLENKEQLLKISADKMKPMIEVGETSRRYFHDNLYDLLARNAIREMQQNSWKGMSSGNQTESLPEEITTIDAFLHYTVTPASDCDFTAFILQIYQSLLQAYSQKEDDAARLLTGIDALRYLNQRFSANFSTKACREQLQVWIRQYADVDVCPEAYVAMALYFRQNGEQAECLKLAREGIAKYPRYAGINQLKNIEKEILNPMLQLKVDPAYPGAMQNVKVTYKNLTGITLQLYKVDLPVTSSIINNRPKNFLSRYAHLQKEEHFDLEATPDYLETITQLKIQAPSAGLYFLRAIPDGHRLAAQGSLMYVTALQIVYHSLPGEEFELVVVDSQTGHPVPDAEIKTYTSKNGEYLALQSYAVNAKGTVRCNIPKNGSAYCHAVTPKDTSMLIENIWGNRLVGNDKPEREEILKLFTDRSIYRPGQTVYVSGLAYEQLGDSVHVSADKEYTVVLRDVNRNEIGKTTLKTNSFGSFSGQFTLPSPCLTGYFLLTAGGAYHSFKVEEYKRPTFDVTFNPVKAAYQAGDSIQMTGFAKTFAGAPVQGAKVHYEVTRERSWFRNFGGGTSARWEGNTVTDADGQFTVPVRFAVNESGNSFSAWYYNFNVRAIVTNGAGETQEIATILPLGNRSMIIGVQGLAQNLIKEKPSKLTFTAVNLSNQEVKTEVTYEVYRQTETENDDKSLLTAVVTSNQSFMPESLYALPSGAYRLRISAKDSQGRKCTAIQDFILFSLNDKRPPVADTPFWLYQDGKEFSATSSVDIYMGSSAKNVYLMYDVFAGNVRLESRRIEFSDSVLCFKFPYREVYGDGILVNFAFVKDGKFYSQNVRVFQSAPEKKLKIKWETFRDKLRPGQKEEWRLNVLYPDGQPAQAELLATMYDASLNQFAPHSLSFALRFPRSVPYASWNSLSVPSAYLYVDFPLSLLKFPSLEYSRLLVPSMNGFSRGMGTYGMPRSAKLMASASNGVRETMDEVVFQSKEELTSVVASKPDMQEAGDKIPTEKEAAAMPVRQNFAETAFFYPQLRTNEKGEISIAFVLPESLTRWKFLGLAHTQTMDYAHIDTTATASKEFMLQPNMPRFVRMGDHANIAASLINLSDKVVKGTVRMELFNPETNRVFLTRQQNFSVGANETDNVSFTFDVGDTYSVIACRMIADGGTFSDGEQNYIPVLTDKQWITESLSLDMNGAGTKTFSLESLFNHHSKSISGQRMTVEFTSHPAWMAVQALPALTNPQGDDAYTWAAAYYANSLARFIVQSHPRIKQVFDTWMAQGGTKDTFMSELQKNEALKNIILAETPWMAEAVNETEQRRSMATLFDLNTMSNRLTIAVAKLQGMQTDAGAWSWYPGMSGNRYITTQITELLARLRVLSGGSSDDGSLSVMYQRAKAYLSNCANEEYKAMKMAESKGEKNLLPSEQTLQYLYICALDKNQNADIRVNNYFISRLAESTGRLTIYGKALAAIILQQAGKTKTANEFMQSLMEYSVETPEMGRYFDTRKAEITWFSYKIPTEVAAIEALQYMAKDEAVIEQMKRWLLKEKQTQMWDTPIATVNAIYALLNNGADMLANAGSVKIALGSEVIRTQADDPVGYVKKAVEGNVMNIKNVTLTKTGDGMGWGAVYAQYWEDMDKTSAQSNALSINRVLMQNGKPLAEGTVLHVGDRVTVRLTVKADRDMDFVQIKDDRAACMEPVNTLSDYQWESGLGYYQAPKDASVSFFIDRMPKGIYVIEYQVYINRTGTYQGGIATIQSAYAPQFGGHTQGYKMIVK